MSELRWVCVAACLLIVVGAGCKPPPPEPSKLVASPAHIEFSPSAIGVSQVRKVLLTNEGGTPLTVHGATSTTATVEVTPFEPFELKAGEAREVEVRFTPAEEGVVWSELNVHSDARNAGPDGVVQLKVSAHGVKSLVEVVTGVIDFGPRVLGEPREETLLVSNRTQFDSPMSLDFAGADADQFSSSEAGSLLVLRPGELRRLPVRFVPKRLGTVQASARVTVCVGCEPVEVPLSGTGIDTWLEVTPSRVDFGRVARGESAEASITLRNQSLEPLVFGGVKLLDNESGAFRLVSTPSLPSDILAPGAQVEVRVGFSATASGPVRDARLEIDARPRGATKPALQLPLTGEGGASCLVFRPHPLDFGVVAEGMSITREVGIFNQCQSNVLLSNLTLTTQSGGDFHLEQAPASLTLPAGQSASVPLTFQPKATGVSEAGLSLEIQNGHSTFTKVVHVKGTGQVFAPCHYELEPATVDFGQVQVGSEVTLGVGVRNLGTTDCFLTGMRLAGGSSPSFHTDEVTTLLAPGKRALLHVRFKPDEVGNVSGMAEAWINHPNAGHMQVVLHGQGVRSCFSVRPAHLDFGAVRLSCGPRERELVVYNDCPGPTTLLGMSLEGDTTNFKVTHGLMFPAMIWGQYHMKVAYESWLDGENAAALRFDLGTGTPYTVGLAGKSVLKNEQTDEFIQQLRNKVDVLFVVDNSGSMMDEQQNLGANFSAVLGPASARNVDYHIAVTTTGLEHSSGGWAVCPGGAEGGENGRLFPVDNSSPRVITPTTPWAEAVFARNTQVGVCHWNEQGLEAMFRALSDPLVYNVDDARTPLPMDGNAGFLREDATLAIIVVSDEEDFSPQPVSFYETFLLGLKGGDRSKVSFSAVVGPEDLNSCRSASSSGSRYIQLARATDGVVENICTPNWAASLERISKSAFTPTRVFPLSETPSDTSHILVRVDGVEMTTGWTYSPATNSIVFEPGSVPAVGATVTVTYREGC
ncbi:choice-of-anchor D domain-containing protein [Archangium lansingense]|uniref:choice-of-anchor D domain-containing protein n=1 Tax=Archangium lansingense TaxID=2995310 RepID=UPI003B7B2C5B